MALFKLNCSFIGMPIYQLRKEQVIPTNLETIWDFISSPANLKEITPDYMGFDITSEGLPEKMYPGMMISYKVRPMLNIPLTWVTEITHVEHLKFFVDEQRVGPYRIWHHEHHLEELEGGIKMTDIVTYQPPMGFLGGLANSLIIKKQLDEIFDHRFRVIEERLGKIS
jgi:ligand-binding SRPBCC domain-containing protein